MKPLKLTYSPLVPKVKLDHGFHKLQFTLGKHELKGFWLPKRKYIGPRPDPGLHLSPPCPLSFFYLSLIA